MSVLDPENKIHHPDSNQPTEQESVQKDSLLSVTVGIRWQGEDCQFEDYLFVPGLNLRRDHLPLELEKKLFGLKKGARIEHVFNAGELIEARQNDLVIKVKQEQFHPTQHGVLPFKAALGRFYPREFFNDVTPSNRGDQFPCRIVSIQDDKLEVDFNHPLAGKSLVMELQIESISRTSSVQSAQHNDLPAMICDDGPGLQDRLADKETDFWLDNPFSRLDPSDDSEFFQQPSLQPFWDAAALLEVSHIYKKLIPDQSHILDLMAGVHSPLQQSHIVNPSVTCAGLNPIELDNNPICNQTEVLNVNTLQTLPYAGQQFDAVLIHAAIEYVINPELIFSEIARVLKPGGRVIISFSNRSVPEKVIQLWAAAHEFERPGIVLSYLRQSASFEKYHCYSKRGLFRPEDDALADKLRYSDPVYVVWAKKLPSQG